MPDENSPRSTMTEEEQRAATVGELQPLDAPILAEYDPEWPALFAREEKRIREALGERVERLEHVGSTSVPGLVAKPRIDILLVVPDSAEEAAYVPALEAAEHRVLKGPDTDVNVHVFSPGCVEIDRMLLFRDRLRTNAADRECYARAKRELAAKRWQYVQNYADAKTAVVEEILARAGAER